MGGKNATDDKKLLRRKTDIDKIANSFVQVYSSKIPEDDNSVEHKDGSTHYLRRSRMQKVSNNSSVPVFNLNHSLNTIQSTSTFSSRGIYIFDGEQATLPVVSVFKKDHEDLVTLSAYNGTKEEVSVIIPKDRKKIGGDSNRNNRNLNTQNVTSNFSLMKQIFHSFYRQWQSTKRERERKVASCTKFDLVDLAIVYDTTYCDALDGKENTETEIATVIALVSKLFQQDGLCVKVEVSYLEGYCDVAKDPYKAILSEGNDAMSLLEGFKDFWNENREDVNRTVAHLFTATKMDEKLIGRAYGSSICRKDFAYGIDQITWSTNLRLKAGLVAHELGHNMGADHLEALPTGSGCETTHQSSEGYIMNKEINDGHSGFHDISVSSMRKIVDSQTCMQNIGV